MEKDFNKYMWIIFALSASVLWGLSYVLFEQIYKKISVVGSLTIVCFVMFVVLVIWGIIGGQLKTDLRSIAESRPLLNLLVWATATAIIAELCIAFSIANKNATLAGLIEISYPIFIALFAYLLFKESQLSLATIIGGLLVFAGIFTIYFFNR